MQSTLIFTQRNKYKSSPTSLPFSSSQLIKLSSSLPLPPYPYIYLYQLGFSINMAEFPNEKGDMAHVDQKYAMP